MKEPNSVSGARSARAAVNTARRLIVMPSPASVEEAAPHLEDAVRSLTSLADALRRGDVLDRKETLGEVEELQRELEKVRTMLDYAAAWHAAWAKVLHAMAGGYGPTGEPAAAPIEPRFSIHA